MSFGFSGIMASTSSVNLHGLTQNCYFCTVAALNNKTTDQLVAATETMMQDTAQKDEILRLFFDAGNSDVAVDKFDHHMNVERWVNQNIDVGDAVGVAYTRVDGSGHMVVLRRELGRLQCIDFQAEFDWMSNPPRFLPFPPEPNLVRYLVFYNASVDALTRKFSRMKI